MNRKSRSIAIHAIGWLLFLLVPMLILRAGNIMKPGETSAFYFVHAIRSVFVTALFYLNYFFLIPHILFEKRRALLFFLFNVLVISLILLISKLILEWSGYLKFPMQGRSVPYFVISYLTTLIIVVGVSFGFKVYNRMKIAETQKSEVELSYVKSRLNPHFLFNTLNAIYALAVKRSDATADAVSRLSTIMRYVITESESEMVLLDKEIGYINDFIELQKLRLTERTKVVFTNEGITADKKIVPLLLISFVENAFKYGLSTEQDVVILIKIEIRGDELNLKVVNSKVAMHYSRDEGGLGLESAHQLLEHFYRNKYTLSISENKTTFNVDLKIELV